MAQGWSEERREQARQNMRELQAKRKAAKLTEPAEPTERELALQAEVERLQQLADQNTTTTNETANGVSETEYQALLRRLNELEQAPARGLQSPQVSQRGSLVGTYEKYTLDFDNYEDPTLRLANEVKLLRIPFKSRAAQNGGYFEYDLIFEVTTVSYETKDGVNTQEPRFVLKLNRFLPDPETDEPTDFAYTACQFIFHEDPQAALVIARDNNFPVDRTNESAFLNEMRYLRMRDWLFEAFFPPKPSQEKKTKQMVIGNRLVDVFEVSSEKSERFDFSKLNHKL